LDVTVNRKVDRLQITIYNAAGEVVRHLTDLEAADLGPGATQVSLSASVISPGSTADPTLTISIAGGTSVVWDGRSDNGSLVADGTYYVEVRSEGEGGTGTVVEKAVAVLAPLASHLMSIQPNVLSSTSPTATILGPVGTTLRVVIYTAAGEKAAQSWGIPGTGQAIWDSTGKAPGLYLAVINSYDTSGKMTDRIIKKLIVR
jgi:hypothetical protein